MAPPAHHMILHALSRRYSIWIRHICLMYNYCVYNNLDSEYFPYKRSTICKACIIMGRAGRVICIPLLFHARPWYRPAFKMTFDKFAFKTTFIIVFINVEKIILMTIFFQKLIVFIKAHLNPVSAPEWPWDGTLKTYRENVACRVLGQL